MTKRVQEVGRSTVDARVERGGMGILCRATDTKLGGAVAIEALPGLLFDVSERLDRVVERME